MYYQNRTKVCEICYVRITQFAFSRYRNKQWIKGFRVNMKSLDINIQTFFDLLRAGLWANREFTDLRIHGFVEPPDWEKIYQLAEGQSVVGLVLAGLELSNVRPHQELLLQWIGEVQMIEQQNNALNGFVAKLIEKLREADVYAILVKGQGIAQCYERPLWRASGDVDLLLSDVNYENAKKLLIPIANDVEQEYKLFKHIGMTMKGGFVVELHGTLHSRLSKRVDRIIDDAQKDLFCNGNVRSWQNDNTQVFLPGVDEDVVFVFTHILHHFYIEGIGLRQICDWCRLLWTYKESLNRGLLESRIRQMGLVSEWKAFAALAMDWLGMPVEAMPLYSSDKKWSKKAEKIIGFVLETGNFGHNREAASGKVGSAWNKMKDFVSHTRVFPLDSIKFFFHFVGNGVQVAAEK